MKIKDFFKKIKDKRQTKKNGKEVNKNTSVTEIDDIKDKNGKVVQFRATSEDTPK